MRGGLCMTQNQLKWFELNEGRRHNLATEKVNSDTLEETRRHNVADEGTKWFSARSSDVIGRSQAAAAHRQAGASESNAVTNRMNAYTRQGELAETSAHNRNVEAETIRHDIVTETQGDRSLDQKDRGYNQKDIELALQDRSLDLQEIKNEINRRYYEGKITNERWRMAIDAIDNAANWYINSKNNTKKGKEQLTTMAAAIAKAMAKAK